MALSGSLPQINLGVQGETQGDLHKYYVPTRQSHFRYFERIYNKKDVVLNVEYTWYQTKWLIPNKILSAREILLLAEPIIVDKDATILTMNRNLALSL
ncbi:hypothetical protein TNCV_3246041 [Trichonephila clavipes]|nr:hypothetical protein TNCV_3246041 [Trichonephila clavipes]